MKKIFLIFLLTIFYQISTPRKVTWTPEMLSNYVKENLSKINPNNNPYYLIDPNNFISEKEREILLQDQKTIFDNLKIKVLFVVIDQMKWDYRTAEGIEEFTNSFTVSLLGDNLSKDYTCVLISIKDRRTRISTGETARKTFSDRWCRKLLTTLQYYFDENDQFYNFKNILYFMNHYWRVYLYSFFEKILFGLANLIVIGGIKLYWRRDELKLMKISFYLEKLQYETQDSTSLNDVCLICLESFKSPPSENSNDTKIKKEKRRLIKKTEQGCSTLKCKHKFHTVCLEKWLVKKNSCPICRGMVIKTPPIKNEKLARTNEMLIVQRALHPYLDNYYFDLDTFTLMKKDSSFCPCSGKNVWLNSGGISWKW